MLEVPGKGCALTLCCWDQRPGVLARVPALVKKKKKKKSRGESREETS